MKLRAGKVVGRVRKSIILRLIGRYLQTPKADFSTCKQELINLRQRMQERISIENGDCYKTPKGLYELWFATTRARVELFADAVNKSGVFRVVPLT